MHLKKGKTDIEHPRPRCIVLSRVPLLPPCVSRLLFGADEMGAEQIKASKQLSQKSSRSVFRPFLSHLCIISSVHLPSRAISCVGRSRTKVGAVLVQEKSLKLPAKLCCEIMLLPFFAHAYP